MTHIDKVAIRLISVLSILLFACKNENSKYPDTVCGDWISVESDRSWIRFDSTNAVYNIRFNDNIFHDTTQYIYINVSGRGVIPVTDESCPIGAIEFHFDNDDMEQLVVSGDNYNMQKLFTYFMVSGRIPRTGLEIAL